MTKRLHRPVVMAAGKVDNVYPRPVDPAPLRDALEFLENGDYKWVLLTLAEGFDDLLDIVPWLTPWGRSGKVGFQFRNRLTKGEVGEFRVTERYLFRSVGEVSGLPEEVVKQMVDDADFRGSLHLTFLDDKHNAVERMTIVLEPEEEPELEEA